MSDLPAALPRRHCHRTIAEKLQIAYESIASSVLIAAVTLGNRINANKLHN
jgi:hypothetical protein